MSRSSQREAKKKKVGTQDEDWKPKVSQRALLTFSWVSSGHWLGLASVGCLSAPAAAKVCVVVTFDGTAACFGHSAGAVDRHVRRPGTNHTVAFPQNALVFFAFVRASSDEVLRFVFVFLLSCEALTWVFQLVFSLLEALAR